MNQLNPLISIITVNWNQSAVTLDCIASIKNECTYTNLEIIVVDNNSLEDPTEIIHSQYPDVIVIRNDTNAGFAGGNNIGIKHAKGDFLFFVNNDTEFTSGLVSSLLKIYQEHADAGIVCPKFQYYYNKGVLEYAGYKDVNPITGRNHKIGGEETDHGQFTEVTTTAFAHGAAMLVSKKNIEKVGLMPEEFFLYYEEFDWCMQFRSKGLKIYFQPNALIYHKESVTTGVRSPLKTYYHTRNRILFMKRNFTKKYFFLFCMFFIFFTIPKNSMVFVKNLQFKHLASFWKGIFWHFNHKISFN